MANSHLQCRRNSAQLFSCHVVHVNSNFQRSSTQLNCAARLANNVWSVHSVAD